MKIRKNLLSLINMSTVSIQSINMHQVYGFTIEIQCFI